MRSAMMIAACLAACGGPQPQPQPQPQPHTEMEAGTKTETVTGVAIGTVEEREPEEERGSGSIADAWVAAHNDYRKQHCAAPLAWSADLAKAAQAWADQLRKNDCAFEHSRTRYGENLAGGTSGALDPASSVAMWYREVDQYDFRKGGFSMDTGHFTQVVWAGTQRVGCGVTTCNGMDIIVCNYDPPGNVEGGYRQNVKPTGCK